MKRGRPKSTLTEKEEQIMQMLWHHGPLFVKEMVEHYDEPRPHFNTVATTVRILEQKGYVGHNTISGSHQFYAIADINEFRRSRLSKFIKNYFSNDYLNIVSALVEDEKISVEQLKELIEMVERQDSDPGHSDTTTKI